MPRFLTKEDRKKETRASNRRKVLEGNYYYEIFETRDRWDTTNKFYIVVLDDRKTYDAKKREGHKANGPIWNFEAEAFGYASSLEEAKEKGLRLVNEVRDSKESDYTLLNIK